MIELTQEKINTLFEISDRVEEQEELASEILRTVQDQCGHKKHKFERDGQEVELTENILWQEVWHLGKDCQAGKILQKEHPELFEAYEKQNKYAEELQTFAMVNFGMDYKKMTLANYVSLINSLIDFKLSNNS